MAQSGKATTSRDRMRRSRQRRRDGAVLVCILLSSEGIADLVEWGWLPADAPREAVPGALLEMMMFAYELRLRAPQ